MVKQLAKDIALVGLAVVIFSACLVFWAASGCKHSRGGYA
jgi:hypothetical protein